MSHGAATPFLQRQAWLGAVQRLDLALFVGAEHDGMFWRIEIELDQPGLAWRTGWTPINADKLGLRRRRIKQSVTGLLWEEYPARELDCSQSPFFIGALCPRISMAPGRRLNIGEAPVALP